MSDGSSSQLYLESYDVRSMFGIDEEDIRGRILAAYLHFLLNPKKIGDTVKFW